MRILFSNPPWFTERGARWGVRAGSRWPFTAPAGCTYYPFPFLMAYAVSYLRQNGVDAYLVDSIISRETLTSYLQRLKEIQFDWVVIETSTPSIENDLAIAQHTANFAKVALTGPHATTQAEELIKLPFIHAVIQGEYERGSLELARTGEEKIYEYMITEDVDSLPFPYRDYTLYQYMDAFKVTPRGAQLQIWGSRGCPYACTFCLWPPVMYNKTAYRPRKPEKIIEEVAFVLKNFPLVSSIYFDDDTFNIGDERIQEISRGLKRFGLPWQAMCRADTTSLETFKIMKDCGCNAVKFGVESGSQQVVDSCNKKLDLQTVKTVVAELKKMEIFVHLTFTFGLPGETKEDQAVTRAFIDDVQPDSIQTSGCTPFPGTALWNEMNMGKQTVDFSSLDGQKAIERMRTP